MSNPCSLDSADLFTDTPTQMIVDSGLFSTASPISGLQNGGQIEITIKSDGEHYIDLPKTMLFVTAQILKADRTKIEPADKCM